MIFQHNTNDFLGFEFAVFKLRAGVTEEQLINLSHKVDEQFLSQHDALLSHFLLKGSDGLYADVAIATTQKKAKAICQLWRDDKVAQEYLELIDNDSVNMSFWSRIS